ncbi:efflux transporter outer membrane subunit [Crenobacter sp. SG2305]|uniref:efflux transporter outer membrane subunit n=1 Tax=Crenobacter oryzisoli TaxID=3056844 RepID=UPI0025AB2BFB|nr:efflux transporter outer membrane subunit [Crenobacter sp. SG2305]MDN0081819.1 efflux transporter outer membrane subunit [Crenobacter sp. SG2305]
MSPAKPTLVRHTRLIGVLAACLWLCCGCAVGPDFVRPAPPALERYDSAPIPTQLSQAERLEQDWWTHFQSPALDRFVATVLSASPNVEAAEATLRQSEAERRAGAGVFYPSVTLGYSAQRERLSPARLGLSGASPVFNLYTLGATLAYSLDLFGGNRRAVEALSANVDLARYRLDAARLALAGNAINAAIAYAAYTEQIAATRHIIDAQRRQLALIEAQVDAGVLPASAALAQRSQLDATEASLPSLEVRAAASRHLLAALAGQAPSQWSATLPDWADWRLPSPLPLTLPSSLVRQRPDILAAEAQWHAASANLGVATANLFPSISLSASGGWTSNHASGLISGHNRDWSVGPDLNLPLFSGGADIAHRDSARAALDAARANYRQTVATAFSQVADVLSSIQHDTTAATARLDALQVNERAVSLLQATRASGVTAEVDYLGSEVQRDNARIAAIDAQAQQLQDAVALYVALGGGWSAAREGAP